MNVSKRVIFFTVCLISFLSYLSLGNPRIAQAIDSLGTLNNDEKTVRAQPTLKEIERFIDTYYQLNQDSNIHQKIEAISDLVTLDFKNERIDALKRDLLKNEELGILRIAEVSSVAWNQETNSVLLDSNILVKGPKYEKNIPVFIELVFQESIPADGVRVLLVSKMVEKIRESGEHLTAPNTIEVSSNQTAIVKFPCSVVSVLEKSSGDDVAYSVLKDKKRMSFRSGELVGEKANFVVKCKNDFFKVSVQKNEIKSTLFTKNTQVSGKNFKRPLSKKEKLFRGLEKQLDIKILDSK